MTCGTEPWPEGKRPSEEDYGAYCSLKAGLFRRKVKLQGLYFREKEKLFRSML